MEYKIKLNKPCAFYSVEFSYKQFQDLTEIESLICILFYLVKKEININDIIWETIKNKYGVNDNFLNYFNSIWEVLIKNGTISAKDESFKKNTLDNLSFGFFKLHNEVVKNIAISNFKGFVETSKKIEHSLSLDILFQENNDKCEKLYKKPDSFLSIDKINKKLSEETFKLNKDISASKIDDYGDLNKPQNDLVLFKSFIINNSMKDNNSNIYLREEYFNFRVENNLIDAYDNESQKVLDYFNQELWFEDLIQSIENQLKSNIESEIIPFKASLDIIDNLLIENDKIITLNKNKNYYLINGDFYQLLNVYVPTILKINNNAKCEFEVLKSVKIKLSNEESDELIIKLIREKQFKNLNMIITNFKSPTLTEFIYINLVEEEQIINFKDSIKNSLDIDILYRISIDKNLSDVIELFCNDYQIIENLIYMDNEKDRKWIQSFPITLDISNQEKIISMLINTYYLDLSNNKNYFINSSIWNKILKFKKITTNLEQGLENFNMTDNFQLHNTYNSLKKDYECFLEFFNDLKSLKIEQLDLWKIKISSKLADVDKSYKYNLSEQHTLISKEIRDIIEPLEKADPEFWSEGIYKMNKKLDKNKDYKVLYKQCHIYLHASNPDYNEETLKNLIGIKELFKNLLNKQI